MDTVPTVFVLDDDPAVRNSLQWLLESVGLKVETYESSEEFIGAYADSTPGCLVLDVRIPGTSGLDLLEQFPQRKIGIPVIVLTGYGDVPMAVRALKGGAVDFIEKPFNDQTLVDSVHKAIRRDGQMRRQRSERMESALRVTRLTPRERQVMDLVVVGRANKQVAGELGCSCKTVEVHRARVMEKMQADSVAALVRMALLLEEDERPPRKDG